MPTLSDWNSFFGSTNRPNFGEVHTKYGTPDFEKEYFWSDDLVNFHHRLLDTLSGDFEMLNILITGMPGVGKTSFLYYLKHFFEKNKNNKFVLKIFHSNHARGFDDKKEMESKVQEEIIQAWEELYTKTGHKETFESIKSKSQIKRRTLNDLSEYYLRNKSKFEKILIFAVDDVDLLNEEEVRDIVKAVISNVEAKSVKKWFFVRPQTYNDYDEKTKSLLQSFFPDARELPKTKLFNLVDHRIKAVSTNPKNPFSRNLCGYIEEMVSGNIRRAFPILESILCEVTPPTGKQSQEFVANHIDRVSIKTLIKSKIIPDLHSSEFRSVNYPIPLDLIQFLLYTGDLAILKPCLDDATRNRYLSRLPKISKNPNDSSLKIPYVRESDMNITLEKLTKHQIIEKVSGGYKLTKLGKVIAIFISQPYFTSESIVSEESEVFDYDKSYIDLISVKIDHQSIAQSYILRSF